MRAGYPHRAGLLDLNRLHRPSHVQTLTCRGMGLHFLKILLSLFTWSLWTAISVAAHTTIHLDLCSINDSSRHSFSSLLEETLAPSKNLSYDFSLYYFGTQFRAHSPLGLEIMAR